MDNPIKSDDILCAYGIPEYNPGGDLSDAEKEMYGTTLGIPSQNITKEIIIQKIQQYSNELDIKLTLDIFSSAYSPVHPLFRFSNMSQIEQRNALNLLIQRRTTTCPNLNRIKQQDVQIGDGLETDTLTDVAVRHSKRKRQQTSQLNYGELGGKPIYPRPKRKKSYTLNSIGGLPTTGSRNMTDILTRGVNFNLFKKIVLQNKKSIDEELQEIKQDEQIRKKFSIYMGLSDRTYPKLDPQGHQVRDPKNQKPKQIVRSAREEVELVSPCDQAKLLHKGNPTSILDDIHVRNAERVYTEEGQSEVRGSQPIETCYGIDRDVRFGTNSWDTNEWEHVFPCLLYSCICGLEINNTTYKQMSGGFNSIEEYIFSKVFGNDPINNQNYAIIYKIMVETRKKLLLLSTKLFNQAKCSFKLFTLKKINRLEFKVEVDEDVMKQVYKYMFTNNVCRDRMKNAEKQYILNSLQNAPPPKKPVHLEFDIQNFRNLLNDRCNKINEYWGKQSEINNRYTNQQILFIFTPIYTSTIITNSLSYRNNHNYYNPSKYVSLGKRCYDYIKQVDTSLLNIQSGGTLTQTMTQTPVSQTQTITLPNKEEYFSKLCDIMEELYIIKPDRDIKYSKNVVDYFSDYSDLDVLGDEYIGSDGNIYVDSIYEFDIEIIPQKFPGEGYILNKNTSATRKNVKKGLTTEEGRKKRVDTRKNLQNQRRKQLTALKRIGVIQGGKKKTQKKYNYNKKSKNKKAKNNGKSLNKLFNDLLM
jgi:hypothetical protein